MTEAVSIFASDLDYERALSAICELCVSQVADWIAVDIRGPDGHVARVAAAHADPAKSGIVRNLLLDCPPNAEARHGIGMVLREGEPELIERVSDHRLAELSGDNEQLRSVLSDLGLYSCVIVPIRLDQVVGAITIALADHRRTFDENDLALVQRLAGSVGIALEKSRIHRAQQEARAQAEEAVRARDTFLSIASHELRNPLSVLQLGIENLRMAPVREGTPLSSRQSQALDRVARQVSRLSRLVDSLLDVSRLTTKRLELEREPTDLAALVRDVASRWESDHQPGRVSFELMADTPMIGLWDRMRLEQVITNLLSNAMKYGAGKPIRISVEGDAEIARLVVQDHGVGIAPPDQTRIFEQFERVANGTSVEGLGLGLWIVRQIVEASQGEIEVESKLGEGSTFTVRLPRGTLSPPTDLEPQARPGPEVDGLHEAEILLVEDEEDALEIVADLLRSHGYSVAEVSNGKMALEYLAHARVPRVILLDLMMPEMDGAEFLRTRQRLSPPISAIPVVLISADAHLARRAEELDVAGYLPKPIDIKRLLSTIELYCRRGGHVSFGP